MQVRPELAVLGVSDPTRLGIVATLVALAPLALLARLTTARAQDAVRAAGVDQLARRTDASACGGACLRASRTTRDGRRTTRRESSGPLDMAS